MKRGLKNQSSTSLTTHVILSGLCLCDFLTNFCFDFISKGWIILQEGFNSFTTLPKFIIIVAEPASALLNNAHFNTCVEDLSDLGNSFSKHKVKFSCTERRSHFILNHLHLNTVSNCFFTVFDLGHSTDIQAHRSIELQ